MTGLQKCYIALKKKNINHFVFHMINTSNFLLLNYHLFCWMQSDVNFKDTFISGKESASRIKQLLHD